MYSLVIFHFCGYNFILCCSLWAGQRCQMSEVNEMVHVEVFYGGVNAQRRGWACIAERGDARAGRVSSETRSASWKVMLPAGLFVCQLLFVTLSTLFPNRRLREGKRKAWDLGHNVRQIWNSKHRLDSYWVFYAPSSLSRKQSRFYMKPFWATIS